MSTRRELLQISTLAAAAALSPKISQANTAQFDPTHPSGKKLNILILGGTGFTGPNQVRYALSRGHKVTLFNRGRKPKQWPGEVEELLGDRDTGDVAALKGRKWDVCIDNPTSLPFWVRDVGEVLKGNVKHYIFISTISVYASDSTVGADESAATQVYKGKDQFAETMPSLLADMSLYGPLKAASEAQAKKYFGANTTIIRPGFIVGPEDPKDRLTYWVARMAQPGGEMLVPGDGKDPIQYIDPRDLAEWTIRMAEARTFGTFNATGPNFELNSAAFFYGLRAVTTGGVKLNWVDTAFIEKNQLSPGGDLPVWVPRGPESDGFATRSIAKATAAGLTFRALATTAQDTLQYFNSLPKTRQQALSAGLKMTQEVELLRAWKKR